ncbi:MAG: hypothetical protein ABR587_12185 [Candidatus Binatia bacterium]
MSRGSSGSESLRAVTAVRVQEFEQGDCGKFLRAWDVHAMAAGKAA